MASLLAGYEAYVALAITLLLLVGFVLELYPPEVTAVDGIGGPLPPFPPTGGTSVFPQT